MSEPVSTTASPLPPPLRVFIVRVWLEPLGAGRVEWRGRAQHVGSGALIYFRDWPTLAAFLTQTFEREA